MAPKTRGLLKTLTGLGKKKRGESSSQIPRSPEQSPEREELPESPPQNEPQPREEPQYIPLDIKFNSRAHARVFEKLEDNKIVNHKAIHIETLQELNLLAQFKTLAKRVHIWDFLNKLVDVPVYDDLTREFIATFSSENDIIKFQLMNIQQEMSMSDFCDIFGFKDEGVQAYNDDRNFWKLITNDRTSDPRVASHIVHPVLRYMQAALSNSLFARGETCAKVTFPELYILKCMLITP